MKSLHARFAMRLAVMSAAIALVLAVAQTGVRADQIPTGWQASNMRPVGYSDLDGRGGAFKLAIRQSQRTLVPLPRPSVESRLEHRGRDRCRESKVPEVCSRSGEHLDNPDGTARQPDADGAAEVLGHVGERSEQAERRGRNHLGHQRSRKSEAAFTLEDRQHGDSPHRLSGRALCEPGGRICRGFGGRF